MLNLLLPSDRSVNFIKFFIIYQFMHVIFFCKAFYLLTDMLVYPARKVVVVFDPPRVAAWLQLAALREGGVTRSVTEGVLVPNNSLSRTIETVDFIRAEAASDHGTAFASARCTPSVGFAASSRPQGPVNTVA